MNVGDPEAGDAEAASSVAGIEHLRAGESVTLPVIEETARIGKRMVETGRVWVQTRTETREQVLRETLRSDAVEVTRVPIDRVIADGETAPIVRTENGVTIIPVLEEVLVVEKRLVLKEEVHLRRTAVDEAVEVPVALRRQHAVVDRLSPDGHPIDPLATSPETKL